MSTNSMIPAPPMLSGKSRFWLTTLTFGVIVWIGGILIRAIIANEFFIPGTLDFDPAILPDQERTLFQLISAASAVVLSAYGLVLISAIILVIILPYKRREHGWLLMASILFFLFVPVEVFTGYLDIHFILLWNQTLGLLQQHGMNTYAEHSVLLRETLSHRIGALSGLPVIAMLSYVVAIIVIIWQPLRYREGAVEGRD